MFNSSVRPSASGSSSAPSSAPQSRKEDPEQPYQTKKGCLIMLAVFGGLIALAVATMLVTGLVTKK